MSLRHLSLCTGYGGLDIAVEALLDVEIVALAEFDKHAAKICEARFSGVPNLGDIKTAEWASLGDVDLITAGYPCQPFSLAGRRKGTDDDRHLWPYIAEAIRVLRPGVIVLENVYGHLSQGFDVVLGSLASLGYDARWRCLRASDVGACHKRERVFIVAADASGQRAARLARGLPRAAAQDGRSEVGLHSAVDVSAGDLSLLPTPASRDWRRRRLAWTPGRRNLDDAVALLPTPTSTDGGAGHGATMQGSPSLKTLARDAVDWGKYAEAIEHWEALFGPAPMPSEPNSKGGRRLHAPFVEWMMGAPKGWVTDVDIPRTAQLKALGNGVVWQQAYEAVGSLL